MSDLQMVMSRGKNDHHRNEVYIIRTFWWLHWTETIAYYRPL